MKGSVINMARIKIYKDNYVDSTVISNRFIDEYMKDANDAQLKVYLYLLRMLNANQATSVSDIADQFNHTEKDVIRSLKYWEKQGLIILEYDEDKTPIGIRMCDLDAPVPSVKSPTSVASAPRVLQAKSALKEATTEVSPAFEYSKPSYTMDQLREFKNRENTPQLFFIAEQYIGRPLSPSEMKTILFFTDELHFNEDLIDYLLQYCVEKGKKDFKYIEKVAINWATEGVSTVKQAQKCSTKYDKNVYAIMNELGKNGSPTAKEMEFINRWTREYGFTTDIIFEACERTVLATDKHRFEYAESILSNWKEENVHHKADIHRIDALYQKKKNSPRTGNVNKFNQFSQNNYDFEALEKQLLSN